MKEYTVTMTAQITEIVTEEAMQAALMTEEELLGLGVDHYAAAIKDYTNADDVVVTGKKVFIHEKEEN